jgi:hypothetical protein
VSICSTPRPGFREHHQVVSVRDDGVQPRCDLASGKAPAALMMHDPEQPLSLISNPWR